MAAGVMRVHAQIMAETMREESDASPILTDLLLIALQDAHTQQPLDRNLMRHRMHIIPQHALPQHLQTSFLHPQHHVIHPPTLPTKPPPYRKRPRDIRRIAPILPSRI